MTTIGQSNRRFVRTLQTEKQFRHAMKKNTNLLRRLLHARFGFDVWRLPVCERCEGYALWDKTADDEMVGTCMACGHTTHEPITVEQYYTEGHHSDRTLHPDAPVYIDRERVRKRDIATVYGGEAGLKDEDKKIVVARR